MKKHFSALLLVAAILTANLATGAIASGKKIDEPMQAAITWLSLADAVKAQDRWNQAAGAFKAGIELQDWETTLPKARQPLGAVKQRKHLATEATTALPGVPDGEYAIMGFQTEFANKKALQKFWYFKKKQMEHGALLDILFNS
ncbi:DUF4019 domain-containing protein [Desulfovibrio falkowii]|uniref:DUF4019 domain-containing protein n=1 Tax=Desulfovibrio sp. WGS1351 TaxID=3366814 RepID=UPI00372D3767